jgi:hypothetical protein
MSDSAKTVKVKYDGVLIPLNNLKLENGVFISHEPYFQGDIILDSEKRVWTINIIDGVPTLIQTNYFNTQIPEELNSYVKSLLQQPFSDEEPIGGHEPNNCFKIVKVKEGE